DQAFLIPAKVFETQFRYITDSGRFGYKIHKKLIAMMHAESASIDNILDEIAEILENNNDFSLVDTAITPAQVAVCMAIYANKNSMFDLAAGLGKLKLSKDIFFPCAYQCSLFDLLDKYIKNATFEFNDSDPNFQQLYILFKQGCGETLERAQWLWTKCGKKTQEALIQHDDYKILQDNAENEPLIEWIVKVSPPAHAFVQMRPNQFKNLIQIVDNQHPANKAPQTSEKNSSAENNKYLGKDGHPEILVEPEKTDSQDRYSLNTPKNSKWTPANILWAAGTVVLGTMGVILAGVGALALVASLSTVLVLPAVIIPIGITLAGLGAAAIVGTVLSASILVNKMNRSSFFATKDTSYAPNDSAEEEYSSDCDL
ncbi:MAG TPA: hypothetical protein DEO98_00065, partial [Legionellales bacterium]|nr:hypothetical protein [Legionellales bacterium]